MTLSRRPLSLMVAALGFVWVIVFFCVPEMRVLAKPIPALCLAALCVMARSRVYGVLTASGLVGCAFGDILLGWADPGFLLGMGAFLLGHVLFVAAFVTAERRLRPLWALPFAAWGVAAFVPLLPNLGSMILPVAAYVVVIAAMMWRAFATAERDSLTWLAPIGAVSFGLSDTVLAFARWDVPFPVPQEAVMPLYWLGLLLIALAALVRPAAQPQ